ncbi:MULTISPECIES: metallophosphoesterase family protein [unclassified Bradyrhizobium]|uniref:metallophosphoesterase family protein n=1 Tax=unclassified Bradyrhizobium TaxID=2631580 RepID=UPI001CD2E312|nr:MULTISPECIES: metallophosphoesterase family protein [unclassified Bradyrhizobium]
MPVALLSDIHGNDVALRAVLADIRRHGVDHIVCLGDVATFGPSPQRAVELRVESNCLCIMGKHDALLLEPKLMRAYTQAVPVIDAINWCREQLTRDSFDYFASFKPTAELPLGLGSMLLYHGSPRSNVEDILATTPSEQLDTLFEERQAPVMAGGHTHLQMLRQHRGSLVLNVGSVGMPFKEYVAAARPTILAHAEYAIVEEAGGVVSVTLYRVPLDKKALQDSLAQSRR